MLPNYVIILNHIRKAAHNTLIEFSIIAEEMQAIQRTLVPNTIIFEIHGK